MSQYLLGYIANMCTPLAPPYCRLYIILVYCSRTILSLYYPYVAVKESTALFSSFILFSTIK